MEVGLPIRMVREALDLTLADVAKHADISVAMLSLVEAGKREPSAPVLRRIAGALGIPHETLLIISEPSGSSLRTDDTHALRLVETLTKLARAEAELRQALLVSPRGGE